MQPNVNTQLDKDVLEQLIESAPIAVVTVGADGIIQYVNRQLEEMFGYARHELIGQPVEVLMPERFHAVHREHRAGYAQAPKTRNMGSAMDLVGRRKDGSEIPIEAGLSYIHMDGELLVMGSITDISRRKQAEEILEQRVAERTQEIERRRHVAEGLRYILATLNSDKSLHATLEYTVAQACRLLDADACALYQFQDETGAIGIRAVNNLSPEFFRRAEFSIGETEDGKTVLHQSLLTISDIAAQVPRTVEGQAKQALLLEYGYNALLAVRLMIKDRLFGGITLYYTRPREFSAEDAQLAVNVSDHAALAIENARLRERAQQAAVVAERGRIARDLHDSVTQTLFSAKLIAEVMPTLQQQNPEEAVRRAEELRQLTRGALAEMRTLLLELRPATLAQVAIDELFRQLVDAASARARIPIDLHIVGDETLPTEVKTVFFNIAQEALNNIVKHARATQAAVHLSLQPDHIALTVLDDGVGFEPFAVTPEHLGLTIMHERVSEIGAALVIDSQPDEGTQISVTWRGVSERPEDL